MTSEAKDQAVERIKRFRVEGERYQFDWDDCHFHRGWAQVDTSQDAAWYGTWAHPLKRQILTFCEGDVTLETADSGDDFVMMVLQHYVWNRDNGYRFAIDGMCQEEIIEAFEELGLGAFLH